MTSSSDTRPCQPVLAHLEQRQDYYLWVVASCPFCGEHHTHGGGSLDGDPRKLLGGRVAHCSTGSGGVYELFDTTSLVCMEPIN